MWYSWTNITYILNPLLLQSPSSWTSIFCLLLPRDCPSPGPTAASFASSLWPPPLTDGGCAWEAPASSSYSLLQPHCTLNHSATSLCQPAVTIPGHVFICTWIALCSLWQAQRQSCLHSMVLAGPLLDIATACAPDVLCLILSKDWMHCLPISLSFSH